jgi:hypothetical protein
MLRRRRSSFLKLARNGLIYLSLSMLHEEAVRTRTRPDSLILPMALDLWRDAWKAVAAIGQDLVELRFAETIFILGGVGIPLPG